MTSGRIVALRGAERRGLMDRIAAVRSRGDVPLVGDDRWPDDHWREVVHAADTARPQHGTAWATLTSGTTGRPRIVLRSAESWSASFAAVDRLLGVRPGDVVALPAPPASSLSLFSIAHALSGGPRVALARGHAVVASDFAEATLFHGTPSALRQLLDAGVTPAPRAALVGGSSLDAALRTRAEDAGVRVVSYYGAAELSFVAVDTGDGLRPFPGVELEVREGELWVRSPYICRGYLPGGAAAGVPDPADAPAAPSGPLRSEGDWHTVGDRARMRDGRILLEGRRDDAILTASATVIPGDVEEALRLLPGVADAVVLGLPADGIGSLVAAVIEPAPHAPAPTARALSAAAAELLTPTHRPRRWYSAKLPRTVTGKTARAELLRRIRSGEVTPLEH